MFRHVTCGLVDPSGPVLQESSTSVATAAHSTTKTSRNPLRYSSGDICTFIIKPVFRLEYGKYSSDTHTHFKKKSHSQCTAEVVFGTNKNSCSADLRVCKGEGRWSEVIKTFNSKRISAPDQEGRVLCVLDKLKVIAGILSHPILQRVTMFKVHGRKGLNNLFQLQHTQSCLDLSNLKKLVQI